MPRKHITQKEAREFKRRAEVAEGKLNIWCTWVHPGISVGAENITNVNSIKMRMARKLGFGLLIVPRDNQDAADICAVKV